MWLNMSSIMYNQNQDGGRNILGPKQQNSPKKTSSGVPLSCFLEIIAELDLKSFFHHLDFDCTLL
jgi:hypothetical protein